MLTSLKIQNIQSHKNTTLRFVPGVNVVTGQSNTGKSAVMRAFKWLMQNRPAADSIKSHFADDKDQIEAVVQLDGSEISRFRNKDGNGYSVENNSNDYNEYVAIRSDVPEAVTMALNINDINFSSQHDGYFLLQDSAGEVARKLNDFIGLDIIDRSQKICNSKITQTKRECEELENRIKEGEQKLESLEWIEQAEKDVNALESLESDIGDINEKIHNLKYLNTNILECQQLIVTQDKVILLESNHNKINDFGKLLYNISSQLEELTSIKNDIEIKEAEIINSNDFIQVAPEVEKLDIMITQQKQKTEDYTVLSTFLKTYTTTGIKVHELEKGIEKKEKEFDKLLKENGVCPLCLKKL